MFDPFAFEPPSAEFARAVKVSILKSIFIKKEFTTPDIAQATIRQSGDIARTMERDTGVEFLHLEMGVPGLPPEKAGVEAECRALQSGVASQYPNMFGIPELKQQASRFIRAFLDIGIAPQGCIPTVGSMQGLSLIHI